MPTEYTMESEPRKSTLFRSKLFWAMVGVPLTGLVAAGCLLLLRMSELDSQLNELRAKGLPTTAREVNDFYIVPDGVTDTTDLWVAAIDTVQAANLSKRGKTLPFIGEGPRPVPPPGEAWAELEASRALLSGLDAELKVIWRAAAAGGQARYPVDFSGGINTLLPLIQDSRQVARLLTLDAHVSAHDGDTARVLQDLQAIFALSDSLRGEPCLISQLVRIAIHAIGCNAVERLLPHCQWSDTELQSLQAAIGSARFKDEMSNALCGERATCLSALNTTAIGPFRQSNKLETLRLFEGSIEGFSGSWSEAIQRQRELAAEIKKLAAGKLSRLSMWAVLNLLPALDAASIAGARATARQKCAIVAIAAQRYRLKHDRFPTSLAEIDDTLLGVSSNRAAQLTDPFNGNPLRYKMEDTRIVIYSVGRNEKDDGGDVDFDQPPPPLDFGFTLKR
jgi:hypothetical protein